MAKSRELTKQIYYLTNAESFSKDYYLRDQIITRVTNDLKKETDKDGNLDHYKIVWNQLERVAGPGIREAFAKSSDILSNFRLVEEKFFPEK